MCPMGAWRAAEGQDRPRIRTRRRLTSLPPAFRALWPYAKLAYTFATAAIAPLRQVQARLLGGSLPTRVVQSVEEIVARAEGSMTVVRSEEHLVRAVPIGVPREHRALAAETEEIVPRVPLAELPGGRVLGPYRAVMSSRGTLIGELSPYFGIAKPTQNPVFVTLRSPAPTFVPGRVGVLAARGDVSYYHYLTDVLPRLALVEQHADMLYMPASLPHQQQLIELMGIAKERIIDADQVRHLKAETLVVPGLPDADLKTPPWIVSFLRDRLMPSGAQMVHGRRLYITRGARAGSRIVTNEADVLRALEPLGFTVLDPGALPVAEQILTFAQAEWIVAPHGAALTNLAFASPGASVVELFAPDYVQGCYWKLSDCVPALTYRYLVGSGRPPRRGRMDGVDSDMLIDVGALLGLLEDLPAGDAQPARATIR
jgi:hypothetical protein